MDTVLILQSAVRAGHPIGALTIVLHEGNDLLCHGNDLSDGDGALGDSFLGIGGFAVVGNAQIAGGLTLAQADNDLNCEVQILCGLAVVSTNRDGAGQNALFLHILHNIRCTVDNISVPATCINFAGAAGRRRAGSGRSSGGSGGRSGGGGSGGKLDFFHSALPTDNSVVVGQSAVGLVVVQNLGIHMNDVIVVGDANVATGGVVGTCGICIAPVDDLLGHSYKVGLIDLAGSGALGICRLFQCGEGQFLVGLAGVQTHNNLTCQILELCGSHGQGADRDGSGQNIFCHLVGHEGSCFHNCSVPVIGGSRLAGSDFHIAHVNGLEGSSLRQIAGGCIGSQNSGEEVADGVHSHTTFVDVGAIGGTVEADGQLTGGGAVLGNTLCELQILRLVQRGAGAVLLSAVTDGDRLVSDCSGGRLAFHQCIQGRSRHQDVLLGSEAVRAAIQGCRVGDAISYAVNIQISLFDCRIKCSQGIIGNAGDCGNIQRSGGCRKYAHRAKHGGQYTDNQKHGQNARLVVHGFSFLL